MDLFSSMFQVSLLFLSGLVSSVCVFVLSGYFHLHVFFFPLMVLKDHGFSLRVFFLPVLLYSLSLMVMLGFTRVPILLVDPNNMFISM
jgi:hypothetical protein